MAGEEREMAAEHTSTRGGDALSLQIALSALFGFSQTLLWALTGGGYFWPGWVWLGLSVGVGLHLVIARAAHREPSRYRALQAHADATALVVAVEVAVWLLTGAGYFWAIWP